MTVQASTAPRNTDLATLWEMLQTEHASKCDMVIPAHLISAQDGKIVVTGADPVMDDDGVTDPNGTYDVTETCDDGISAKLQIPLQWLRRMHRERTDVWDFVVNGLLHGGTTTTPDGPADVDPDGRTFLLRTFVSSERRVARALLSDSYKIVDNVDILVAVLQGVAQAGVQVDMQADLTDRHMRVRLVAPGVSVIAEELLQGYRSPFASPDIQRAGQAAQNYSGGTDNVKALNAGFVIGNSETGDGGWTITPRAEFPVCRNGLVVKADMLRGVHLGGKQTEGIIRWSEDTREKELAVITAKVKDVVEQFLSTDYLHQVIARIREQMQTPVTGAQAHVQAVAKKLAFDPAVAQGVLDHFILGGQMTSGGVMQAVTSYAQTVADAELAADLEEAAMDALAASVSLARVPVAA